MLNAKKTFNYMLIMSTYRGTTVICSLIDMSRDLSIKIENNESSRSLIITFLISTSVA